MMFLLDHVINVPSSVLTIAFPSFAGSSATPRQCRRSHLPHIGHCADIRDIDQDTHASQTREQLAQQFDASLAWF
jgi:hypothetical protein